MKIKKLFWGTMHMLPLLLIVCYAISTIGTTTNTNFSNFITSILGQFENYFYFAPVQSPLHNIFQIITENRITIAMTASITIISYEVFIIFLHICYEVIAFIPKFCIKAFEKLNKGE